MRYWRHGLVFLFSAVSVYAAESEAPEIQALSVTGGNLADMVAVGNRVFLAKGPHLVSLDVSEPARPKRLGELQLPGVIQDLVALDQDRLLAIGERLGVVRLSVSDPANPRILDSSRCTQPPRFAFLLEEGRLGIQFWTRLSVFRQGETGPLGQIEDYPFPAAGVGTDFREGLLAVASSMRPGNRRGRCLVLYRFDGSEAPTELAVMDLQEDPIGVALSERLAAVSERNRGISLFDIQDPNQPKQVAFIPEAQVQGSCSFAGSHLLVPTHSPSVILYDLSDVSQPTRVGAYQGKPAQRVIVEGGRAYALASSLEILDISDPKATNLLGSVEETWTPKRLCVREGRGVALDNHDRLITFDLSNAESPRLLGATQPLPEGNILYVTGTLAIAGGSRGALLFVDLSDLSNPGLIGRDRRFAIVNAFEAVGSMGCLMTSEELYTLDLKQAPTPRVLGVYRGQALNKLALHGQMAYLAGGISGLHLVDLRFPVSPHFLGLKQTPGNSQDVALRGKMAYVCQLSEEILCFDLSDPANPSLKGKATAKGRRIEVDERFLYVLDFHSVSVFSLEEPTNPRLVAILPTSFATDLALDGEFVYVADTDGGLKVFPRPE